MPSSIADILAMSTIPDADPLHVEKFMRAALEQAALALTRKEVPVGCVIVHRGEVIGVGHNETNLRRIGTRHAEFVAMEQILESHPPSIFTECELYVSCEPCIMCASALLLAGFPRVFFGCKNKYFGGCGSIYHVHETKTVPGRTGYASVSGLFEEEAIAMFRSFYSGANLKAPVPKRKIVDNAGADESAKIQSAEVPES